MNIKLLVTSHHRQIQKSTLQHKKDLTKEALSKEKNFHGQMQK